MVQFVALGVRGQTCSWRVGSLNPIGFINLSRVSVVSTASSHFCVSVYYRPEFLINFVSGKE